MSQYTTLLLQRGEHRKKFSYKARRHK